MGSPCWQTAKVSPIDPTRYGHATAFLVPWNKCQMSPQSLWSVRRQLSNSEQMPFTHQRLQFAHSDWAAAHAVTAGCAQAPVFLRMA